MNSVHLGGQDTKFYSKTLSQPKGQLDFEKFHFPDSRRIQLPKELAAERVLADRDEIIIVNSQEARDTAEAVEAYGPLRPRGLLPTPSDATVKGQPVQIRYNSSRVPKPILNSNSCRNILGKLKGLRGYCYQTREHSVPTPTQRLGNFAIGAGGRFAGFGKYGYGSPTVAEPARYVR